MRFLNLIIITTFVFSCASNAENIDSIEARINLNSNKFKYMLETIYQNYADTVDIDKLSEKAFKTLLNSLDKNSAYFTKDQLYKKQVSREGSEIGIGIEFVMINDTAVISKTLDNSPAEFGGLKIYDKILGIDDISIIGKDIDFINNALRAEKNSVCKLNIADGINDSLKTLSIKRTAITISSLFVSMKLPGTNTGYISMRRFSKISHGEFSKELEKLMDDGIDNLIIDLRNNPGGFLDQVDSIIDEFFVEDKLITHTKARNQIFNKELKSSSNGCCKNLPLVLILNQSSASACELFAGVLQDYDRGLIVGQRSFGKSSAQRLWNMTDSTGFQMTVAKYFTPLGRIIEKNKKDSVDLDISMKLNMGDSLYLKINELVSEFGGETNLPVFKSEGGRTLLGGGGIFPDYFVEEQKNTLLTDVLIHRNIIFEYVYYYLKYNYSNLISLFANNEESFALMFRVDDEMLWDLKKLSYTKNIWNEEMFIKDKYKIQNYIKAEIARALFGNEVHHSILIKKDVVVEKALDIMPEAPNLINNLKGK